MIYHTQALSAALAQNSVKVWVVAGTGSRTRNVLGIVEAEHVWSASLLVAENYSDVTFGVMMGPATVVPSVTWILQRSN